MNREEILAKSRSENRFGDEKKASDVGRAIDVSQFVGLMLCLLFGISACIFLSEYKAVYYACFAILFGSVSAERFVCARRLKGTLRWAMAVFTAVLFVCYAAAYVVCIVKAL